MGLRADEGADDVEILRYIERYRHRRDLIYVYRVVAANCIGLGLQTGRGRCERKREDNVSILVVLD